MPDLERSFDRAGNVALGTPDGPGNVVAQRKTCCNRRRERAAGAVDICKVGAR